jgi:glycosyltransferase involved in cell wall biosynthesis
LDRARYTPVVFSPKAAPWHDGVRSLDAEVIAAERFPRAAPTSSSQTAASSQQPAAITQQPESVFRSLRKSLSWYRWLRRERDALTQLFQQRPVDILHTNNAGDEPAPIAARRAGTKTVIATLHTDPTYDLFGERTAPRFRRLQQASFASLDLAIAVSARTAFEWRKHLGLGAADRPRFEVVPNGIRLERLARRRPFAEAKAAIGLPADRLVIGSLGRLDWAKGYGDLVAALPAVLAAVPAAEFIHAGRGPLAASLAADAERRGIGQHVHWLGFRPDVRDLLEACDLYVQPSWCEAHTLSVLEAGALGLAVVASDVGGHAETLADGSAGWIVPARDPAALAAALIEALGSAGSRTQRGNQLSERVRTLYTSDRMVKRTMELYDSL